MGLKELLLRDDIPEDAKDLLKAEIKKRKSKKKKIILTKSETELGLIFEDALIPMRILDFSKAKRYIKNLTSSRIENLNKFLTANPDETRKIANMVKIVRINKAALELFQVKNIKECKRNRKKLYSKGNLSAIQEQLRAFKEDLLLLLSGKMVIERDQKIYRIKGGDIISLMKAKTLPGSEENLSQILVSNIDITPIKRIEENLRKSDERFRLLFKEAPFPLRELDLSHAVNYITQLQTQDVKDISEYLLYHPDEVRNIAEKVIDVRMNDAALKMYGVDSLEDYIAIRMDNWDTRKDEENFEIIKNYLRLISGETTTELPIITPGKNKKIYSIARVIVVPGHEETLSQVLIANIDLTEIFKAELKQKELDSKRENFIWMTSHELRTPLTVIKGYIEILKKNFQNIEIERQNKIFNTINNNLNRIEQMIGHVSMIVQLEKNLFDVKRTQFNFSAFLSEILEPYQELLGSQLYYNGSQEDIPLLIKGDKTRLQQVLFNLIDNAIKQTHPEHRKIDVSLQRIANTIQVIISDNGAGIDPENIGKIFEQFVSIGTEFSVTGTGLGLYLCKNILKAHDGTLVAQSEGLQKGASFIIDLPLT